MATLIPKQYQWLREPQDLSFLDAAQERAERLNPPAPAQTWGDVISGALLDFGTGSQIDPNDPWASLFSTGSSAAGAGYRGRQMQRAELEQQRKKMVSDQMKVFADYMKPNYELREAFDVAKGGDGTGKVTSNIVTPLRDYTTSTGKKLIAGQPMSLTNAEWDELPAGTAVPFTQGDDQSQNMRLAATGLDALRANQLPSRAVYAQMVKGLRHLPDREQVDTIDPINARATINALAEKYPEAWGDVVRIWGAETVANALRSYEDLEKEFGGVPIERTGQDPFLENAPAQDTPTPEVIPDTPVQPGPGMPGFDGSIDSGPPTGSTNLPSGIGAFDPDDIPPADIDIRPGNPGASPFLQNDPYSFLDGPNTGVNPGWMDPNTIYRQRLPEVEDTRIPAIDTEMRPANPGPYPNSQLPQADEFDNQQFFDADVEPPIESDSWWDWFTRGIQKLNPIGTADAQTREEAQAELEGLIESGKQRAEGLVSERPASPAERQDQAELAKVFRAWPSIARYFENVTPIDVDEDGFADRYEFDGFRRTANIQSKLWWNDDQIINTAFEATLEPYLRFKSGAATPQEELVRYHETYRPTGTDTEEQVALKLNMLWTYFNELRKGLKTGRLPDILPPFQEMEKIHKGGKGYIPEYDEFGRPTGNVREYNADWYNKPKGNTTPVNPEATNQLPKGTNMSPMEFLEWKRGQQGK